MPAPSELPREVPVPSQQWLQKATPRLWGWGSKVAKGGGHGDSGTEFLGRSRVIPHALFSSSFPKRKPTFPSPTLPPLPSCSNRQGHWLEKPRPQPCPSGFVGGGAPACPLPPLPPFGVLQAVIHFPIPTYGQGSRLLGDAHLFWKAISRRGSKMFSSGSHVLYLASEKGGGQSVKKKKRPGWGMT